MTNKANEHTLIIDIGKTHVKLHILDSSYQSKFSNQMSNAPYTGGDYPCANVSQIWNWLCETTRSVADKYNVKRLTITTHGATAALINRKSESEDGLVLPVLDYECSNIFTESTDYENSRDSFSQTFSPSLPAGLNLGRQLYWLKQQFPAEFLKASDILMYPQYWVWRFTGQCFSEITSLGCHSDLWSIASNDYSALVDELDCRDLFPPLQPAWYFCGNLLPQVSERLGLSSDCEVYNGLHDSNASFLRYRLNQDEKPFTVVSTGTWTILMASQVPLGNLEPSKDMLANIDALGAPIACARFMGGREFEAICEQAGSWLGEQFTQADIQKVIDRKVFALADFSDGSGPFGGRQSTIEGAVGEVSGIALATLYCALMIDYQLEQLAAQGDIFIEGAFLKNPLLCALVNQLRPAQKVSLSLDSTGTVVGAAYLTNWDCKDSQIETKSADTTNLSGLNEYKQSWLELMAK